jgi:hypothetical protein
MIKTINLRLGVTSKINSPGKADGIQSLLGDDKKENDEECPTVYNEK